MLPWLLSPLAWLLLAGLIFLAAWWRRRTWMLVAGGALGLLALVAMTPLAANHLSASLEHRVLAPPGCDSDPPTTAVVLGGGFDGWPRHARDFSALNLSSRRRVESAATWWHGHRQGTVVLQGGAPYPGAPAVAQLMAVYAEALGVPAARLRMETESRDTWSNALEAARMSPRLPLRVVLVTSAIHMPRARETFVHNGFDVCPRASDFRRLPSRIPWALVPRTRALANTEVALHEKVGLLYYRWRIRRDEPVPAR